MIQTPPNTPEVVLVTGMSGAGRSTAARALEDLGWFVIDNLPPSLLATTVLLLSGRTDAPKVAVVIDVRGRSFFEEFRESLEELQRDGTDVRVLFLEAGDEVLVRRFESNRRPHPLQGTGRVIDGLTREREVLADLRGAADLVIDTTNLNIHELRRRIDAAFSDDEHTRLRATLVSFGFKYGIPVDADFVADVRFLPNPYWQPELRELTGLDGAVNDAVVANAEAGEFLERYSGIIDLVAGGYLREGKRYVTIAIGCTGGKHRSVAIAENLATRLVRSGVETLVAHRDLGRE